MAAISSLSRSRLSGGGERTQKPPQPGAAPVSPGLHARAFAGGPAPQGEGHHHDQAATTARVNFTSERVAGTGTACQWVGEWLDSPRELVLLHPPGRRSSSQSGPHEVTM